jgi:hypothetical protein
MAAIVLPLAATVPSAHAECNGGIVPQLRGDGEDQCEYRHIPYQKLKYGNNKLTAIWPAQYEVLEMYILADFAVQSVYVPGASVPFQRDTGKSRYDFAGHVRDTSTGEELLVLTPMWCRDSRGEAFLDAPTAGCPRSSRPDDSCSDEVPCWDGSTATVSCSGESCSTTCGTATVACCTATLVEGQTFPDGTEQTDTINRNRRQACPPQPEPEE